MLGSNNIIHVDNETGASEINTSFYPHMSSITLIVRRSKNVGRIHCIKNVIKTGEIK